MRDAVRPFSACWEPLVPIAFMQAAAAMVALAYDGLRGLCDRALLLGFAGISTAATVPWRTAAEWSPVRFRRAKKNREESHGNLTVIKTPNRAWLYEFTGSDAGTLSQAAITEPR